jgi:hypothetical protein
MLIRCNWFTLVSSGLIFVLTACSSGDAPVLENQDSENYPSVPPAYTGLPANRPVTKVLTTFAQGTIERFSEDGSLVINTSAVPPLRVQGQLSTLKVDEVAKVAPGTVIVSPPTEKAPYGVLRKVKSVTKNPNGTTTVETTNATLAEAIAGSNLKPGDVKQTSFSMPLKVMVAVPKNGAVVEQKLPDHLTPEMANQLAPQWNSDPIGTPSSSCKTSSVPLTPLPVGTMDQRGCIQVQLWLTVNIDIGWWFIFPYLQGFGAWANGFAKVDTGLDLNFRVPVEPLKPIALPGYKQTLIDDTNGIAVFWVGPIPVVVTPKTILEAGLRGTLNVTASAGATLTSSISNISFNLGTKEDPVQYGFYCGNTVTNGNWGCRGVDNTAEKIEALRQQFTNWNPTRNPLQLSASASLSTTLSYQAYLSLQEGIYLYGVVGLAASLEPYVGPKINATMDFNSQSNQVNTALTAGVYAGVIGRVFAGVDLLGIQLRGDIFNKDLVPPTPILGEVKSCWRGADLVSCG